MEYRRFRLKRPLVCDLGELPAGGEITILKGIIYFNGGMIEPPFYPLFHHLIDDERLSRQYLEEVPIPFNKV